ncbi:hypothetical protein O181_047913 [Austropuccinia psidii MF-1]|uniref:Uncharacterized protein n=1 Tax=Austropuccinia psidii MF-1 TaxID=1389203 RepID=A0A9Q3DWZ3_9BASI|nr:hypothetical protein [Austropuccinia psidii MF-1]
MKPPQLRDVGPPRNQLLEKIRATRRWVPRGREVENGKSHLERKSSHYYFNNRLKKDTPTTAFHGLIRHHSDPPTPVMSSKKGILSQKTHPNRHKGRYCIQQNNHKWPKSSQNLSILGGFQKDERDTRETSYFLKSEERKFQYNNPDIDTLV